MTGTIADDKNWEVEAPMDVFWFSILNLHSVTTYGAIDTRVQVLCVLVRSTWAGRSGSCLQSQHFGRPRQVDCGVKRSRPSWSTWWNPVSTKNAKLARVVAHACNPSYSDGWGRRIASTREAEFAVSRDHTIALQPGQQERNFVSKNKK